MITCRDVSQLVTDYTEGRLSTWDRLRFQLHLGLCTACRTYLAQVKATAAATGRVSEVPMPADVEAELLQRFRTWKDEEHP